MRRLFQFDEPSAEYELLETETGEPSFMGGWRGHAYSQEQLDLRLSDRLEENLDCLCTYSESQYDEDFDIGDQVIVVITRYNYEKKQIYGKIIAKW